MSDNIVISFSRNTLFKLLTGLLVLALIIALIVVANSASNYKNQTEYYRYKTIGYASTINLVMNGLKKDSSAFFALGRRMNNINNDAQKILKDYIKVDDPTNIVYPEMELQESITEEPKNEK